LKPSRKCPSLIGRITGNEDQKLAAGLHMGMPDIFLFHGHFFLCQYGAAFWISFVLAVSGNSDRRDRASSWDNAQTWTLDRIFHPRSSNNAGAAQGDW
jgi:hypothetical protein